MRLLTAGVALSLLAAAASALACTGVATFAPPSGATALPPIDANTSLLVIAPHPDDETLCCAGVIQRVAHAGGRVSIVWITSGDAERSALLLIERTLIASPTRALELGTRRMSEARGATARLGVPAGDQLFLGYPDGGIPELLGANRLTPYRSPSTGATRVPYSAALFPGHPYSGESLERDLAAVLERVQPTLLLAPSPQDSHPDHRAVGLLAIAVSQRQNMLPHMRYWIVHGGEGWPSPRELMSGVPLSAAPRSRGLRPEPFALLPVEEDGKLRALDAYATQMRLMAPFLLAFVRTTELFSVRATADPVALPPR